MQSRLRDRVRTFRELEGQREGRGIACTRGRDEARVPHQCPSVGTIYGIQAQTAEGALVRVL
jgi:hypothetical protein